MSAPKKPITSEALAADLCKTFKDDAIAMTLAASNAGVRGVFPTGITPLDRHVLGCGGLPFGRIVELFGNEGSGKTSIMNAALAGAQRMGAKAVLFEVEHSYQPDWAARLGVNIKEDGLVLAQPDHMDGDSGMFAQMERILSRVNCPVLMAVDSVAACITKKEFEEGPSGAPGMGEQSRAWSKALRGFVNLLGKHPHGATMLLLNQVRTKIGVLYGNPECLHGDTHINVVGGRSLTVREIVEGDIKADVWAWDELAERFVCAPITARLRKGEAKPGELVTITAPGAELRGGCLSLTTTVTHPFLTDVGWKQARDLRVGDLLLTRYRQCPLYVPLTSIVPASSRKYRDARLFDLSVAGPENYMAGNMDGGLVVHNTTPGGLAIKFYASIRLKVNHGKSDGADGRFMGVMSMKNKVAPPYRKAELRLKYETGFDDRYAILHHAKEVGCIAAGVKESGKSLREAIKNLGWESPSNPVQEGADEPEPEPVA